MDFFKKHPIKIALGGLSLVFLLSVAICAQNWNSRLALAFTAIASLSTVATLIIAIKLYDRFGLKNQMVVKQADKIFELFDLLLTQTIVADGAHANWMVRANLDQLRSISATPLFATDADKVIFIAIENYEKFYDSMVPIKQSYWLPREIQESLDFLALGGTLDTAFDPNGYNKHHSGEICCRADQFN